jgi:hypothetical protein
MGWCSSAVPAKLEQKSIIPKVYTHIFSVSHPNGFAIDHYCGRAFLHLVLVCAAQNAAPSTLHYCTQRRLFRESFRTIPKQRILSKVHRGAFFQFPFRWIYYCHSSKTTGKETGKTHLCAVSILSDTSLVTNFRKMHEQKIQL